MCIVLTGSFGFVGSNLSKALNENCFQPLIAIDIKELKNNVYQSYYSWNDLNKFDWKHVNIIIHMAGKVHDTKHTTKEEGYFDINVGLTQKIFDFFLKSSASKFIFFSSVKAVADTVPGEYLSEEDVPNPQTPYGKSKLEAEKYIFERYRQLKNGNILRPPRFRGRQAQNDDKKVYILRPSMIHGPGNKGNLNLLYKLVKKGIPWPLGTFENKRSFTSINNLIFIIRQLIEKDIEPGIYNVADDEPISTNRLIQLIAESNNKKPHIWKINKKLIQKLAKLGDILNLPLNSESLKKLTESYVVSNQKLKNALGIKKMPVNAEDGMRNTLLSFKKQ